MGLTFHLVSQNIHSFSPDIRFLLPRALSLLMADILFLAVDICLVAFALIVIKVISYSKRIPPLPPGPKGYPLIGNALDMPSEKEWVTFAKWGKIWGTSSLLDPVVSTRLFLPR